MIGTWNSAYVSRTLRGLIAAAMALCIGCSSGPAPANAAGAANENRGENKSGAVNAAAPNAASEPVIGLPEISVAVAPRSNHRYSLLIGVSDLPDDALDWPMAKPTVAAMRAGLVKFLHVPDDAAHITELVDGSIARLTVKSKVDAIREALIADGSTPETGIVVVVWAGRTFANATDLHFLTPFSRPVSAPVPFSPTISAAELQAILADLAAWARVLVIVETPVQEFAGPPNWPALGDGYVVSMEREKFRDRASGLPLLTAWWLKEMQQAVATGATFDVLAVTKTAAEKATFTSLNVQHPVFHAARPAIPVLPATFPTVEVQVTAAYSPGTAVSARVKWGTDEWETARDGRIVRHAVKPGPVSIRVEAADFEPREAVIEVPELAGMLRVTVPLAPVSE